MRVPDRTAVRKCVALIAWIALAAGSTAVGCASSKEIQVAWDEREDLSRFRSWDWFAGNSVVVRSPYGDGPALKEQLSNGLESALRERGLERASGDGELRVVALMVRSRTIHVFRRARAVETLYSYHDVGGYEVYGEELEQRPVDRCRLAIYLIEPRKERVIWQAVSERRQSDGCARHLDSAIAALLDQFPPRDG